MFEFVKSYWREILEVVLLLVSVIILIVRKPVSSSVKDSIESNLLKSLPQFIDFVECPGNGSTKLNRVIGLGLKFVISKIGRSLTDDEIDYWTKFITDSVEAILSSPQKKEVL